MIADAGVPAAASVIADAGVPAAASMIADAGVPAAASVIADAVVHATASISSVAGIPSAVGVRDVHVVYCMICCQSFCCQCFCSFWRYEVSRVPCVLSVFGIHAVAGTVGGISTVADVILVLLAPSSF